MMNALSALAAFLLGGLLVVAGVGLLFFLVAFTDPEVEAAVDRIERAAVRLRRKLGLRHGPE